MIPADHKTDIIQSGINFMRSITEAYGAEEGMKLWGSIADTLDPDIKGQIFFSMLTGEYNGIINITGRNPGANRVSLIKAIRNIDNRRLGLKEAKDMSDSLDSGKPIKLQVDPPVRIRALKELRDVGFYI